MHQYKTVAQILLILSIFNLVLAAPVVREIYNIHDDAVVPAVNVEKERRQSSTSDELPPSPDGPTPSTSSHSPPPLDGSTALHGLSPSDGEASLHEGPTPQGGPASLAVSSPPGEIVPETDHPGPASSEIASLPPDGTEALPGATATVSPGPASSESTAH
jgi:hypothetical protein